MVKSLSNIFNWKKHPSNVFLIALPLLAMGAFSAFSVAYLSYMEEGDYWYAIILLVFLIFAYLPFRHAYKLIQNVHKEREQILSHK